MIDERALLPMQINIAKCDAHCEGVGFEPAEGHLPRGLWLDVEAPSRGRYVLIVGQNPGRPAKKEGALYKALASASKKVLVHEMNAFVKDVLKAHPYYTRLRELARDLGFGGQIVWTDLAKCSAAGEGRLPIHQHVPVYSRCMGRWFRQELHTLEGWPIIAAGRATFDALWPLLHDRLLVGVPHPTGSWGHFQGVLVDGKLTKAARAAWEKSHDSEPQHVYLHGTSGRRRGRRRAGSGGGSRATTRSSRRAAIARSTSSG